MKEHAIVTMPLVVGLGACCMRAEMRPHPGGPLDFENEFSPLLQKRGSKPFLAFTDGLLLGRQACTALGREINPRRM